MKKITLLFTAATLMTAFSFAQSTGKLTLVKGQKLTVENKLNTVINQEFMGNAMEITADVTSNSAIEVKGQNDKNYNISNTLTRLNLSSSIMGQEMKYDSDKKEDRDGEMGKDLNSMVNTPMDVEVGENGKVVSSPDAKKDKNDDPGKSAISAMLGGAGDAKGFVELAFMVIPTGMKAGSTWTDSTVNEEGKKITTYTIREVKGNDAVLDIKGTIQNSTRQEMMGNEVITTTSGTVTGESIVDMSTGIVKNHTVTVEATGSTEAMGQQIPLTTKVTSRTTIVPAK